MVARTDSGGLPLAAGIGLFLLIFLGNWALTQWLSISIRSEIETRGELAEEIGQQRRVLRDLEAKTFLGGRATRNEQRAVRGADEGD